MISLELEVYAVADMVSEVEARAFFEQRLKNLTPDVARRHLRKVLDRVPDREPDPGDEL